MQGLKVIFLVGKILQGGGVEFPIFLSIFALTLQQCSATALLVINKLISFFCIDCIDYYIVKSRI